MRRHNKKSKTVNINSQTSTKEKYNLVELPLDVVIEIVGRLPAKSVARFLAVSKLWATRIRSRDFITSFPFGSSSQPSTLIACTEVDECSDQFQGWHLSSSSSSFFLSCDPFPYNQHREYSCHHVNGLISIGYGPKQIVSNPSTGKWITLPRVKTRRKVIKSFFGYDSVNDQYKVLCMTEKVHGYHPSCQHQVFTLGAPKSWKMIDCSIDHRPWTKGVCINSVVYYVAQTGIAMSQLSLMRFDLRSESLDLCSGLPVEMSYQMSYPNRYGDTLLNYKGKVAEATKLTPYTFDVWIMDPDSDTHEWLKITFSILPWKSLCAYVNVIGITHTGEFILTSSHYSVEFYTFHYNPDMDSFRSITVKLSADYYKFRRRHKSLIFRVFSDYVESVRLL